MPIFGYSASDLLEAKRRGYREGKAEATDKVGRTADEVWRHFCLHVMLRGERPPHGAPKEAILSAREYIELNRPEKVRW